MKSKSTWWLIVPTTVAALSVAVPLAFGGGARVQGDPGNAVAGKKVFIAFCGKCHTMQAAGSTGTLGPNLDVDRVSFTRVITAIKDGAGGIQAAYVLRHVTITEIYNVAKFVVADRVGAGVTPSSPD